MKKSISKVNWDSAEEILNFLRKDGIAYSKFLDWLTWNDSGTENSALSYISEFFWIRYDVAVDRDVCYRIFKMV